LDGQDAVAKDVKEEVSHRGRQARNHARRLASNNVVGAIGDGHDTRDGSVRQSDECWQWRRFFIRLNEPAGQCDHYQREGGEKRLFHEYAVSQFTYLF
jgi:hypothetical protein